MAVKHYQILQRNENDFAVAEFCGKIPENTDNEHRIYGRVVTEDDNLVVVQWTEAEMNGDEWVLKLNVPSGGLYRFEAVSILPNRPVWDGIHAPRITIIKHFGVGDLYILAGQSNMSGYGRDFAIDPPTLGVHLYANNGKWDVASHPLNDSTDTIYPENKEDSSATSPALSFARTLKQKLNIPIGLVQASLGGSPLQRWDINEDGDLYRSMLKRVHDIGTSVKGILWYQGCADVGRADTYYNRFKNFAEQCRKDLGDIQILTAQLNYWGGGAESEDINWGKLRDAQRRLARDIDYVHIISTIGLTMADGIHNDSSANVVIGSRLAMVALKHIYGRPGLSAPDVNAARYVDDTHVKLEIDEQHCMADFDLKGDGMHVEDASGLIKATIMVHVEGGLQFETERPYSLPAKFHAYWQCDSTKWVAKDKMGMPMLACYDVDIEK